MAKTIANHFLGKPVKKTEVKISVVGLEKILTSYLGPIAQLVAQIQVLDFHLEIEKCDEDGFEDYRQELIAIYTPAIISHFFPIQTLAEFQQEISNFVYNQAINTGANITNLFEKYENEISDWISENVGEDTIEMGWGELPLEEEAKIHSEAEKRRYADSFSVTDYFEKVKFDSETILLTILSKYDIMKSGLDLYKQVENNLREILDFYLYDLLSSFMITTGDVRYNNLRWLYDYVCKILAFYEYPRKTIQDKKYQKKIEEDVNTLLYYLEVITELLLEINPDKEKLPKFHQFQGYKRKTKEEEE
jgi:hypothetical protein